MNIVDSMTAMLRSNKQRIIISLIFLTMIPPPVEKKHHFKICNSMICINLATEFTHPFY